MFLKMVLITLVALASWPGLGQDQNSKILSKPVLKTPKQPYALSLEQLQEAIYRRILWVPEFQQIQQLAYLSGIKKVYIFGGTAAAFVHYVKWDLERQQGTLRHHDHRFDYRYESIFRVTQDLDLVVDMAKPADLYLFQKAMRDWPHFQGNKPASEVLSLRINTPKRLALLNDKDFLSQHSDSHSTGLIEIPILSPEVQDRLDEDIIFKPLREVQWRAHPPAFFAPKFKDLRYRSSSPAPFINDMLLQQLTCYYSPLEHKKTLRFKNGNNPEIFFAIRALTKVFQYDLHLSENCKNILKRVFAEFNSDQDLQSPYAYRWIKKNAKKLYQNAIDLERAHFVLKDLGALKALRRVDPNNTKADSLNWWLKQTPLTGKPFEPADTSLSTFDKASILTAQDLSIKFVEYQTPYYIFYEMLEKSYFSMANVFKNTQEGFQARIVGPHGQVAHRRVALRFRVQPWARLGVDFKLENKKITVLNKYILQLEVESLKINPLTYFKHLADKGYVFVDGTKEIHNRVHGQLNKKLFSSAEQRQQLVQFIFSVLKTPKFKNIKVVLEQWLSLEVSAQHPELIQNIISTQKNLSSHIVLALGHKHWAVSPWAAVWIDYFIRKGIFYKQLVHHVLRRKVWAQHPDAIQWLRQICLRGQIGWAAAVAVLSHLDWKNHPEAAQLIDELLTHPQYDALVAEKLLSQQHWAGHIKADKWLEIIIRRGQADWQVIVNCLNQGRWAQHESGGRLLELILKNKKQSWAVPQHILSQAAWQKHPQLAKWIKILQTQGHNLQLKKYVNCAQLLQVKN